MQRLLTTAAMLLLCPCLATAERAYDFTGEPLIEPARPMEARAEPLKALGNRVRIVSYNIQNFEDGVGEKNRTPEDAQKHAAMAGAIIDKLDADIVILEEVENTAALKLLNDALAKPYPVGFVSDYGTGRRRDKLNDAFLSRIPVADTHVLDFGPLDGDGRPTRGAIRFSVDLGGGDMLLVYAVHLKSNYGVRSRNIAQRKNALALIRADADRIRREKPDARWEVVVAGDFNVDPDLEEFKNDESMQPLADWNDLWLGRPIEERATIPTRLGNPAEEYPPASFDRFVVSPDLSKAPWRAGKLVALQEGSDTNNVYTKPGHGTHVSDHYPVYLDIEK